MSTLSGIVSKGEKGKTKYQSIDINSLYRTSRGESLEQQQQKSTVPRKHGMQSLGKVPSARRPPANLPSLRSETSSSDPAVSLVPSGGSGWATTKESAPTTNTTTTTSSTPSDNSANNTSAQCTTGSTSAIPQQHPPLPGQQNNLQTSHPSEAGNKSSWSAIMSRSGDAAIGYAGLVESGRGGVRSALGLSFLAHQSPQFQHEFPSLSGQSSSTSAGGSITSQGQQQQQQQQQQTSLANAAVNSITNAAQHQSMLQQQSYPLNHSGGGQTSQQQAQQSRENAQYGPGPSLRPQTEGSWIQGGSRPTGGQGAGGAVGVAGSGNIQVGQGPPIGLGGPPPGQGEPQPGGRPNLAPSPGMGMAPAGQQNQGQIPPGPNMHHYRGIIPQFMYRGNFPGGNFPGQFPPGGTRPRINYPPDQAPPQRGDRDRGPPAEKETIQTRPIIKEEDLSRMDDISRDAGWTASDDIDYNQKLAFSDDELDDQPNATGNFKKEENRKELEKQEEKHIQEEKEMSREKEQKEGGVGGVGRNEPRNEIQTLRSWNNQGPMPRDYRGPPGPVPPNYPPQQPSMRPAHPIRSDEEELWNQRRREQVEKVASTIERARQRKEEEEKRFQESTKQAAAKKLQDLENKLKEKNKHNEDQQGGSQGGDSNKSGPASIASNSSTIPIPDWERDRESRERSRTSSSEGISAKEADIVSKGGRDQPPSGHQSTSEFRQIDRPFIRQQQQEQLSSSLPPGSGGPVNNRGDRDRDQREMREPAFSRHFQSNLPPRFQKQQAERSGTGAPGAPNNRLSPSAERSQPVSFSQQYDPSRWVHNHSNSLNTKSVPIARRVRADSDVSGPLDDERSGGSRGPPPIRSDDRHRHSGGHRSGSGYEPPRKPDGGYYDDYPRRGGGERYKDYEYEDRHPRDVGKWADDVERRYDEKDSRDSRDGRDLRDRDMREKKDYDSYSKERNSHDSYDELPSQQHRDINRPEQSEWRERGDDRRDIRSHDDRLNSGNESNRRSGEMSRATDEPQRNERPQRPDSRDSRASRESRGSLRAVDDEGGNFHPKSSRDTGSGSWANDFSDYEDNKKQRDIFREDNRERDRERERERDRDRESGGGPQPRDRRHPPGPISKEKLDQEAVKLSLSQLKRLGVDDKKDNQSKMNEHDSKKDSGSEAWGRNKSDRSSESSKRGIDTAPKSTAWADAVSPTFEKEEEDKDMQHDDDKNMKDVKLGMEKLSIDKRASSDLDSGHLSNEADKDDRKDDKRDKNARNRASSSGSRGPRGGEPRGTRQWGSGGQGGGSGSAGAATAPGGAYNVSYGQRWRGSEVPARGGRRTGSSRMGGGRKGPNYERTDSELSGDEAISGSTESGKDERRPSSTRSPKLSAPKSEKDERNRNANISRKDDQQQTRSEYSQSSRGEKRGGGERGGGGDKAGDRDYDVRGGGAGRSSREGFPPSGEPSRRGRGGFRNNRGSAPATATGSAAGARMEGYGPPPSKSPFSSERADEKHSSTPTPSDDGSAGGSSHNQPESADDKIIAKQQALTAGITGGRHAKSPNQLSANHTSANPKPLKKEESKSKRTRSGSRRGRGGGSRGVNAHGMPNNKYTADPNNEDWETTSENSEEDRKDGHGVRSNKPFGGRNERQSSNITGNNASSHPREPRGNRGDRGDREPRGDKGQKSSNSQSNRAPGSEKGRNSQNASERGGNKDGSQRNHHPGSMPPPLMQNSQAQNGRPRSQGSANSGPLKPISNKDVTVNRIDDIKLNDPNLVNQALSDIHIKSKEKRGSAVSEIDVDGNCIDSNLGDDNKIDADGFQEVRSKKNVKDSSRQQQQKEEQQQKSSSGRREKDKDRARDRSKSKANGPPSQQQQQQQQQQTQNIPPLLGQPIGTAGAGIPKNYERTSGATRQKLAPRFQKQRLAKQQQQSGNESDSANGKSVSKDTPGGVAPPPPVNAWDKPFTGSNRSPPSPATTTSTVPADVQLMSGLTAGGGSTGSEHEITAPESAISESAQRNSPNIDKVSGKLAQIKEASVGQEKGGADTSSPPVQTLIFENTNYSKNTKSIVVAPGEMIIKSKYSNHIKGQGRDKRSSDIEDDSVQLQHQQQQALAAAFSSKPNDLIKDKLQQDPIQMPLSFNNKEDNVDMKLDFTFDSDLSQLTEDKSKSLVMSRSMHISAGQSTISPSTAELNLKIASVKKVWENAPMPTVVEHEVDGNVGPANSFPQAFESADVDDGYSHQQYSQPNLKNEMSASANVCKLVPPQVKPQQQSSAGGTGQPGSTVPTGPSPIGPGQSPIGHPPASLQGPLSPPPFNSTGQPSHINYQEFAQYPGSQAAAAQFGGMSAIPSPPAVLFNTGSGQLPAQAPGGLYGAFQLDQSRSPFTQYPPYAASLQSSFNQQNMYLQQPPPPPPPHAPNAPAPDLYQSNLSQYRLTAAGGPPFGQNQQLSNNPNTVLISSSSNSLMSASVKPSTQPIGAIGTKAPHFQAPSAPPQPNQLAYIPYDPNQVLGVSGSYMGNSQLVQRPGPNVQPSANNYYSATSADVFSGSQTGFYQPGGAAQQTGAHYGLQGFGQHNQSLATGNAAPVGLQNFGSQFLSGSGLQIAAAAAAQQYRNPTSGLPGPANAAATFLSKHQQQEQPRQLKSPSGNQQDVLSVFSSTSPKSRKQQSSSQPPQQNQSHHNKFQQYPSSQSGLVNSYNNYIFQQQQNARGMNMQRGNIQPSQQRYPPPIQRPVNPFPPGPNNSQQGQGQQNCMPNQQQQSQMNRHRSNIHQQQQQQRNMKMQQQYYSGQSNVKMDSHDKVDTHNDKISENNSGSQPGGNKSNANPPEVDNKEEVSQQNE